MKKNNGQGFLVQFLKAQERYDYLKYFFYHNKLNNLKNGNESIMVTMPFFEIFSKNN
jgi:hypothetical protein